MAYVRSVPPVEKEVPELKFGPVAMLLSSFNQMPVMFPAKVIDHSRGFDLKPVEGPTAEFGKYLVNSCIGCHGRDYAGGKIPGGDPSWPPAANIRLGALGWTRADFMTMIQTGVSKSTGQKMRIPMPIKALKHMNETETEALWGFLSSLKQPRGRRRPCCHPRPVRRGSRVSEAHRRWPGRRPSG